MQKAFGYTDATLLAIFKDKPQAAHDFGMLMSTWGEGHALLQQLYPVEERLVHTFDQQVSPVMFIDVGDGYGPKAIALKADFPQLSVKVIVQDLPMSINHTPKVDGIEFQVHDFFTGQPIRGK